jgi:hypothetical protein
MATYLTWFHAMISLPMGVGRHTDQRAVSSDQCHIDAAADLVDDEPVAAGRDGGEWKHRRLRRKGRPPFAIRASLLRIDEA